MSTINFENEQAKQQAAESAAQRDEANARAYQTILRSYTLRDTFANFRIIEEWAKPNVITLLAFEELLKASPQSLDMSSREEIIEDILKNSHTSDANEQRQIRFRLTTFSLGQLRDKRKNIEFKGKVRTLDQAKKFVADARNIEIGWKNSGYPKLQSTIIPRGEVRAIPTGQYLRHLAATSLWDFKRMVRVYSSQQVDFWLAQADDKQ